MDYVIVAGALRYLANHDRPIGGEQTYNSAHLLQLADEVSRAEADRVAAMMAVPAAAETPFSAKNETQEAVDRLKRWLHDGKIVGPPILYRDIQSLIAEWDGERPQPIHGDVDALRMAIKSSQPDDMHRFVNDEFVKGTINLPALAFALRRAEPIPGEIAAIFTNLLDAAKETLNECHAPHWRNLLAAIVEAEKIKVADLSAELTLAEALPSPGGEFLPPLDPNWQSIGDVAQQTNKTIRRDLMKRFEKTLDVLHQSELADAERDKLRALLKDGRDLIEEARRIHLGRRGLGEEPAPAYTAHIDPIIAWLRFLDNPVTAGPLASLVTDSMRQKARRDGLVEFSGTVSKSKRWRLTAKGRDALRRAPAPADADFANIEAHERWKDRGQ